jgi:hypothetical protein
MYQYGLHYYDPRDEKHVAFVNIVSENKEGISKRQIKGVEAARDPVQDFELSVSY